MSCEKSTAIAFGFCAQSSRYMHDFSRQKQLLNVCAEPSNCRAGGGGGGCCASEQLAKATISPAVRCERENIAVARERVLTQIYEPTT